MLVQIKTLKQLFQRERHPGSLIFAVLFLGLSLILLFNIDKQAAWQAGSKWSSQPALWPMIAIFGMTGFAALNLLSAIVSPRIEGRWQELGYWLRAFEYVLWFMIYVATVPVIGYLPSTIVFCVLLCLRVGYRTKRMIVSAVFLAVVIVVLFKTLLRVNVPGGQLYEMLPDGIRSLMLTYL